MRVKVWIDTGANIYSQVETEFDIEGEWGLTWDEFKELPWHEQFSLVADSFYGFQWGVWPVEE